MTNSQIIAVLGMHRSGTSAIARGLKALGVELGDNLMPPVEGNNERGFWEDMDLHKFNVKLLAKVGNAWDKLSPIEADKLARDEFAPERYEAAALIERKLEHTKVFAFKDPRTAVLLPFWRCIFEDLGLNDNYLIALRNPLEVAESLRKRDQLDPTFGLLLWLKYTWSAVRYSAGRKRICVSYSNLMAEPEAELARIAAGFELIMPSRTSPLFTEYANDFLTQALRHNRISDNELQRSSAIPRVIEPFYAVLCEWADAPPEQELSLPTKLNAQLEAFWSANDPLLGLGDRLKIAAATAKAKLSTTEAARAELAKRADQLKAAEAELQTQLARHIAELKAQADTLETQASRISEYSAEKSKLDKTLSDTRTELAAVVATLAERTERATSLEAEATQSEKTLAESRHQIESGSAKIAALSKRASELEAENLKTRKALAEARAEAEAKATALAGLSERIAKLEAELSTAATDKTALRSELDKLTTAQSKFIADRDAQRSEVARLEKSLAEAEGKIEANDTQLAALSKRAADLQAENIETREALAGAQAEVDAKTKALLDLEKRIARLEADMADAAADQALRHSDLEKRVAERDKALAERQTENAELKATLAEATRNLRLARHDALNSKNELSDYTAKAQSQLAASRAKLGDAEKAHSLATVKLAAQSNEVSKLKAALMNKESRIQELAQKASELQRQLTQAEASIANSAASAGQAQSRVAELERALDEKNMTLRLLNNSLLEMRSSTSWRLTKPLRIAKTLLTLPHRVFTRLVGSRPKGSTSGLE